jgi:CspA family cold shock protein
MATGKVKWYNASKGFGFIQPDDGSSDVFMHRTSLERAGLFGVDDNQKISFELARDKGKTAAVNLKLID